MDPVDWGNVLFQEEEEKLALIGQRLTHLPLAVVNLYSSRVKYLDLSSNFISDLNWLGLFPNLETLIIDNNGLRDEVFMKFKAEESQRFENIKTLSLNSNKLENLPFILRVFQKYFPNVEYLSLLKNPVSPDGLSKRQTTSLSYEDYREHVIKSLPKLNFLDYMKICHKFTGSVPEHHARILKFSLKIFFAKLMKGSEKRYSPLPVSTRAPGDHCGSYGVLLYKYKGSHSEGNRFIMNNDL